MDYLSALREAAHAAAEQLQRRCSVGLCFGGEGDVPKRKPRIPTDANSQFLANRAMGDWAEQLLAAALSEHFGVAHYGAADDMQAGQQGFREFYIEQLEAVRVAGKRPDLLVFDRQGVIPRSITNLSSSERDLVVGHATASIEVRSSKFLALHYMAVRTRRRIEPGRAK